MAVEPARIRDRLARFDLPGLFVEELGWDRHRQAIQITVGRDTYELHGIAEKRSMVAFVLSQRDVPDSRTRREIDRQVARIAHEHLIVYSAEATGRQVWQWVRREPGKPVASREYSYRKGGGELLAQR